MQAGTEAPQRIPTVVVANTRFTLLGTAHVSRASAEEVRSRVQSGGHDAVAIELCASRYRAVADPDTVAQLDLFQVIRQRRAGMVAASLALSAYQQRLAEQLNIEPGAEMKAAIEAARSRALPLLLIDREIGVTLRRIYRRLGFWQRLNLIAGLAASMFSRERVTEEEIERLKEGDLLESTFAEFARRSPALYETLIRERDRYMAARLIQEAQQRALTDVLVVVGAGHVAGLRARLAAPATDPAAEQAALEQTPPPGRAGRILPWLVVALILAGFGVAFARSGALGWQLVLEWVLINGTLSAFGTALAGGHPLSVLSAFVAAPLTSLNPTIGAGMVVAAVEVALRRPLVSDFQHLRRDVARVRGWWRNRVARTLLVFVLATLGSAIGTYVAGFRIIERLI